LFISNAALRVLGLASTVLPMSPVEASANPNGSFTPTRFLAADGSVVKSLSAFAQVGGDMIALYRAMVLTRLFDEKAVALQRTGRLGTYASSLGQEAVGVGVASAMRTEAGLFAPVLRDMGVRSVADLRAGLETMKRDVAARTVPLTELRGQTITLSSFGMLGGLHAALVIVPPQVAILGVGRLHAAPRVVGGELRAVRVLSLSLTFDHRAVTGAEAIRFLNAVIADLQT
jgi:hypothetical protein